jgi:GR25 family glycosyltransferase involved in LPS biosynthesis
MEKQAVTEQKDIVLILEDNDTVSEGFKQWHEDAAINIELLVCKDYTQKQN